MDSWLFLIRALLDYISYMQSLRSYATAAGSTTTTKVVARTRPLPLRKSVLLASHQQLIQSNPLVLFLRPGDFSATEWRELRAAIAALPAPPPPQISSAEDTTPPSSSGNKPKLTVLRPGLLPALLRESSSSSSAADLSLLSNRSHLSGPLAVLTAPSLHPPTLRALLHLLHQFSLLPSRNAPPVDPKAKAKDSTAAPPTERLEVLSALFDAQAASPQRVQQVAQLPGLETLRAQIVGLLSAPGARITGVLQARGAEVGRTLEGFKVGLQEQQQGTDNPIEEKSA